MNYEFRITDYFSTASSGSSDGFRNIYAWALIGVLVSAFVSFLLSFQAGLFVLFFLIVGWWVWENPEPGLLFFIVLAPLLPMLKITQTIATVTLLKDVIIIVLFIKVVAWPLATKKLPWRRNVLVAPLAALALWTTIQLLRADSLILGVLRARDIGLYVLLYLVVLYLSHNKRCLRERLQWFIASLLVVLALAGYQLFFAVDSAVLRYDPLGKVWIPRLSSVLAHPSIFGEYLVIAASLLLAVVVFISNRNKQVRGAVLLVLLLPFIYLTYARGVWIGLVAALGTMAMAFMVRLAMRRTARINLWRYSAVGLAMAFLIIVLLLRLTPVGIYLRSSFDPTYGSNEERLEFLARLIAPMTNSEALFGRGLGDVLEQNFREVDLAAYDIAAGTVRSVQLTKNKTLVDNQYLKTFVEMGLVGLLIYGWLYIRLMKTGWRLATSRDNVWTGMPVIGLWGLGFLAAFVVQAFFIDIWDIFPTNAAFWVMAALVSAQAASLTEKR